MTGAGGSGEKDGAEAVVEAIDGEIVAVDGEVFAEAFAFGDTGEGGVSKVHIECIAVRRERGWRDKLASTNEWQRGRDQRGHTPAVKDLTMWKASFSLHAPRIRPTIRIWRS